MKPSQRTTAEEYDLILSYRPPTMERAIALLSLCTAIEGYVGTHVFVNEDKKWSDAQTYCRHHHTDLSFVGSQSDIERLLSVSSETDRTGWIGLQRDPQNLTAWMWSGGGHVTYQNWDVGQPDYFNDNEHNGHIMPSGKWNDNNGLTSRHFYCIQLTVVVEEKSWEEALEHCRQHHTDLSSLLSETDNLMALREYRKNHTTERMWTGLRYLADRWLWVNGDPLEYEAWPKGGGQDHQCPIWNRCGALTKEGLWENRDCQEELNFICY